MRKIISARDIGCGICEVKVFNEPGFGFVDSADYQAEYDQTPVTFHLAPGIELRAGGVDFDKLRAPDVDLRTLWAITYAPGQGLDTLHIFDMVKAPDAAGALKAWARCEDPVRQAGRYETMGRWIQLQATSFDLLMMERYQKHYDG